jgi:hypothetical protein
MYRLLANRTSRQWKNLQSTLFAFAHDGFSLLQPKCKRIDTFGNNMFARRHHETRFDE